MPGPTSYYPPEFKREAIRLYRSSEKSIPRCRAPRHRQRVPEEVDQAIRGSDPTPIKEAIGGWDVQGPRTLRAPHMSPRPTISRTNRWNLRLD